MPDKINSAYRNFRREVPDVINSPEPGFARAILFETEIRNGARAAALSKPIGIMNVPDVGPDIVVLNAKIFVLAGRQGKEIHYRKATYFIEESQGSILEAK